MNVIHHEALRRVFPAISRETAGLGLLLLLLLFPGLPWWGKVLIGLLAVALLFRITAAVFAESQVVRAEINQRSTFIPLEPLDGVSDVLESQE